MKRAAICASYERVNSAWLTQVLREAGVLHDATVIALQAQPVGNGLLGDSVRFKLTFDQPESGAPHAVVAKFPSRYPASRAQCVEFNMYMREVRFYQEIAATVGIRTPRAFFAEIDPVNHEFTLLMEDVAPARPGNQIEGCSVEDCRVAMREVAALHGPRWNDPALHQIAWLQGREILTARQVAVLPGVTQAYRERYARFLEPQTLTVLERFVPSYEKIIADRTAQPTVVHGDFRLDNVLFDVQGLSGTMATLDWQTVDVRSGLADVAFFLGGSLGIADRRAHEEGLVRLYFDVLREHGVKSYSWGECWRDYRRFACRGLFTAVFAPMGVERTPRGDEMFMKMMRHHSQQIIDLDSLAFWE